MKKGRVLAPSFSYLLFILVCKEEGVSNFVTSLGIYSPLSRHPPTRSLHLHPPRSPPLPLQTSVSCVSVFESWFYFPHLSIISFHVPETPKKLVNVILWLVPLCAVFLRALTAENAVRRVPRFSFFKQHKQLKTV